MSSKSLETFTFMLFFPNTENKSEQKAEALEIIRSTINNIEEFRTAEINIKSRKIAVSSDDFYFGFSTQNVFTMGFTTNEKLLDTLNKVLNRIYLDFQDKIKDSPISKDLAIDFYAGSIFVVPKDITLLSKIIYYQDLSNAFTDVWKFSPKKFVGSFDNKVTGEDIEISIESEEKTKLHLISFKNHKEYLSDMAKTASKELDVLADKVIDRLR